MKMSGKQDGGADRGIISRFLGKARFSRPAEEPEEPAPLEPEERLAAGADRLGELFSSALGLFRKAEADACRAYGLLGYTPDGYRCSEAETVHQAYTSLLRVIPFLEEVQKYCETAAGDDEKGLGMLVEAGHFVDEAASIAGGHSLDLASITASMIPSEEDERENSPFHLVFESFLRLEEACGLCREISRCITGMLMEGDEGTSAGEKGEGDPGRDDPRARPPMQFPEYPVPEGLALWLHEIKIAEKRCRHDSLARRTDSAGGQRCKGQGAGNGQQR